MGAASPPQGDFTSYPYMIKLLSHGTKTALDVAQAFTIGQLGERHAQKLIVTFKRTNPVITVVAVDTSPKFVLGGGNRLPEKI
jgi:hypothetical protein